ncbi:hypothetical protein [Paractinoplanes globisporus]|uniref:Cysteine dioxygenase n=1 Tax=Paractinoplanes globisporus TaxID=113565 RepID=A0ABW6WUC1_9ACTN
MVNLNDVQALVEAAPTGATYAELHEAFVRSTRSDIAESLVRLAANLRAGRYPAGRPYRHVNGFTKMVMVEHPSARLTLHIWPAERGAPDDVSRPHDHRYAFSSILLGGRQQFVELEETVDVRLGEPWRSFEYRPYRKGLFAAVTPRGVITCREIAVAPRIPLAGHYTATSAIVHQAITGRDETCVTLVMRGPRERRTSKVYYRPQEPAPRGRLQFGRRVEHEEVMRQVDEAIAFVTT